MTEWNNADIITTEWNNAEVIQDPTLVNDSSTVNVSEFGKGYYVNDRSNQYGGDYTESTDPTTGWTAT